MTHFAKSSAAYPCYAASLRLYKVANNDKQRYEPGHRNSY
ncbi:hypothetical protein THICB6_10129 [Thiomonas arsenitoxydans]|nr:hypothetical protein THICB6_10129 [Thiomonas arsenitoxydans]